jgi:hypothetical protein
MSGQLWAVEHCNIRRVVRPTYSLLDPSDNVFKTLILLYKVTILQIYSAIQLNTSLIFPCHKACSLTPYV